MISGKFYLRKVVEKYVSEELSRINSLAERNGFSNRSISVSQKIAQGGELCSGRSIEKVCSVDSIQHSRGTSEKIDEGVCSVSVNCERIEIRDGNPTFDLCSPEILDAIGSGNCSKLVTRGWENAKHIDWKAIHYTLTTILQTKII